MSSPHDIERVRVAPGDSAGNTAAVYPPALLMLQYDDEDEHNDDGGDDDGDKDGDDDEACKLNDDTVAVYRLALLLLQFDEMMMIPMLKQWTSVVLKRYCGAKKDLKMKEFCRVLKSVFE